jgi:hypothetical protein
MKTPKSLKGYLKMLIQISRDSVGELQGCTDEDMKFLAIIRASIQNELGEDEFGTLKRNGLEWKE